MKKNLLCLGILLLSMTLLACSSNKTEKKNSENSEAVEVSQSDSTEQVTEQATEQVESTTPVVQTPEEKSVLVADSNSTGVKAETNTSEIELPFGLEIGMTPVETWYNDSLQELVDENEYGDVYTCEYENVNLYNTNGNLTLVFEKTDKFRLRGIDFTYIAPSYEAYKEILAELSNTFGEYTTEVLSEKETSYVFKATDYEVTFKELLETDDIANKQLYISFSKIE